MLFVSLTGSPTGCATTCTFDRSGSPMPFVAVVRFEMMGLSFFSGALSLILGSRHQIVKSFLRIMKGEDHDERSKSCRQKVF